MEWTGYPEEHPDLIAEENARWDAEHEARYEAERHHYESCGPYIQKAVEEARQSQHEATWAMAMEAAKNAEIPKDKEVSCYNLRQAISNLPCPHLQTTNEK